MKLSLDIMSGLTEFERELYSELREIIPEAILLKGGYDQDDADSELNFTVIQRIYYRDERIESKVYVNLDGLDKAGRIKGWEWCRKSLMDNIAEYIEWNDFIYNTFAL